MSGRWETIEHTADVAIQVEADSLEELFRAAASGLAGLLRGEEAGALEEREEQGAETLEWRALELEAADRELLLVEWLREQLHLHSAEGLLYAAARFAALEDERLEAEAGFVLPPDQGVVERELKGVTYHDLLLRRQGGGWYARVVLDV